MSPIETFLAKWVGSEGANSSHRSCFLLELCEALEVPRPDPATGDPERDRYCFERSAAVVVEGGGTSTGKIDLYKHDCFVLEAKQGCDAGRRPGSAGRRGTPSWHNRMRDAYGQARSYASRLRRPPPFLLVCDIGHCFDLYAAFDGTTDYREFPDGRRSRIFLADLAEHRELLRAIFEDPRSLDPARRKLRVTREIAGDVARLAQQLEARASPDTVALFLMRCLFTLFAEDVGLLPPRTFRDALATWWLPDPESFAFGVASLWTAMRDGGHIVSGRIRRFGGALFEDPKGLRLTGGELALLQEAARRDWSHVEPAIFGTLLERALSPGKRHRLGAHFTPRSYVERLVRWAVEEPLRGRWELVQLDVRRHLEEERKDLARQSVRSFHSELCAVTVLDPACGSGNFLYVTLDALKRLESEVVGLLDRLGEPRQELLTLRGNTVTPDQFHGIEVERWAREIAELVLWIGYLQWQVRALGGAHDVPEPVLRDYHNFECRDALLEHDGEEPVLGEDGRASTRWDRAGHRPHPVTGEPVPDEAAAVEVTRLRNPRRAPWPDADFVVGNPPFVGNKRMRAVLGDGYVDALRAAYPEVPESADYVMYWWARAAELLRRSEGERAEWRRFGLITTNSVTQVFNRRLLAAALTGEPPLSLRFAVPDHPWVDTADGAAVRIAMTVAGRGPAEGVLARVVGERQGADGEAEVALSVRRGWIHADLRVGPDVSGAVPLQANAGLCGQGMKVVGDGFYVEGPSARRARSPATGAPVVRRIVGARDVLGGRAGAWIVDFFALSEAEAQDLHPEAFQRVLTRVKPLRDQNRRRSIRELWWRFAWERPVLRAALDGLSSYLVTPSTAKHRLFVRVSTETLWDGSLFAVASDDPFVLGVLSSRAHRVWALAAGGTLEDRPTWTGGTCFEPFPFPDPEDRGPREEVRRLARAIEDHRREVRERRPDLGLTPLYNVVEKLAAGGALTGAEREVHDAGLATLLANLHGRLDRAVLGAYGWPEELADEEVLERLVRLNRERAAEEEDGRVRWLRPDLQKGQAGQAGDAAPLPVQASLLPAAAHSPRGRRAVRLRWPPGFPERVSRVRHVLASEPGPWTLEGVATAFHRARRDQVESVLDSLVAVGVAFRFETEDRRRFWQAAAREVA
jgi:hypothetical protein